MVLVVAIAFVTSYLVLASPSQPEPISIQAPTTTPVLAKEIAVYVSGAVSSAGVYSVHDGARVEDAIRAAGGPSAEADMSRINLALRLRDEMHIHVPRVGEADRGSADTITEAKINVNTAPAEELDKLPGIGPTTAAKIIEYRSQKGSFAKIEDLRDLKLVNSSVFEKIKDRITVQ